jgi:hypothetical protein
MEKIFSDRLISSIEAQRNQAGSDTLANRTFDSMIQLVRNRNFRNFLASINVEDLTDFELRSILGKILQEGIDDISLIAQLRQRRARWPELLSRIDELSRRVDLLYGKSLFESIGGIRYSNFEFDVDQGEVNISGLVKTEDTKTFTLMADLIDTFEKSPYFKDVDLRNFAKAKASGANFTGSIQLNFSLQDPDEVDVRDEANPIEAILGVPEVN